MKILHCADLHLDSKNKFLSSDRAKRRRLELIETFGKTVNYAVNHGVTAFIISGDIFDNANASKTSIKTVMSIMQSASPVEFFILAGNHDNDSPFSSLDFEAPNVHIFSDNWEYFDIENVTIAGIIKTYQNSDNMASDLKLNKERFNIVVLHGDIKSEIRLSDFAFKNIDYMALGHIHSFGSGKIDSIDPRGDYAYSGCLEGRGFDEEGKKGFIIYDTDTREINFISNLSKRTVYVLKVDITGLSGFAPIEKKIDETLRNEGVSIEDIVRVKLIGKFSSGVNKDVRLLLNEFCDRYFHFEIEDESKIEILPEEYLNSVSLKGEFVRKVKESGLSEEEENKIIEWGIRALEGEVDFD